jgi:phosphoribosylanthranilate isomerase
LFDAYHPGLYGGAGLLSNWELARRLAKQYPILLAGGLDPANVRRAVSAVQPWGVDVASGVEAAPGRKDAEKMKAFVKQAKQ